MRAAAALALLLTAAAARADRPIVPDQRDVNVVAFWSIACRPCKDELPLVEALYRKHKGDVTVRVVAVNIDPPRQAAAARRMAAALKLTMPQVTGGEAIYERLFGDDVTIPRLAVFDRDNAGLERNGAVAGERAAEFVRDVTAVMDSVRAGAPRAPTTMWAPLGR